MTPTHACTWILVAALGGAAVGGLLGRLSTRTMPQGSNPVDIRLGGTHASQAVLDLLKSVPVVKAGTQAPPPVRPMVERLVPIADPRLAVYSLLPNQSITVTPAAGFSDFVGTVAQGRIYEFVAEPTFGYPATGYMWIQAMPLNKPLADRHYAAVSLLDAPTGQRYLIDFLASAINDGVRGKNCQWVLQINGVDAQVTPCSTSTANAFKEQHVFVVVESSGQHFTYVELSNKAEDGSDLFWLYESATVTRLF